MTKYVTSVATVHIPGDYHKVRADYLLGKPSRKTHPLK